MRRYITSFLSAAFSVLTSSHWSPTRPSSLTSDDGAASDSAASHSDSVDCASGSNSLDSIDVSGSKSPVELSTPAIKSASDAAKEMVARSPVAVEKESGITCP